MNTFAKAVERFLSKKNSSFVYMQKMNKRFDGIVPLEGPVTYANRFVTVKTLCLHMLIFFMEDLKLGFSYLRDPEEIRTYWKKNGFKSEKEALGISSALDGVAEAYDKFGSSNNILASFDVKMQNLSGDIPVNYNGHYQNDCNGLVDYPTDMGHDIVKKIIDHIGRNTYAHFQRPEELFEKWEGTEMKKAKKPIPRIYSNEYLQQDLFRLKQG
jgi:hypothetical protein